jgi:hypothetical protein
MKGHDGTRLLRSVEVIRMVRLPFRRCVCWLVLLIGTLYLAGLRRIFPAIAVRQAIYRLASQPGVPEAFQNSDPPTWRASVSLLPSWGSCFSQA